MCLTIRFSSFEFSDEQLKDFESFRTGTELRINVRHPKAVLPIEHNGENTLVQWGNKSESKLPKTGFCKQESFASGKWQWLNPQPIKILAAFGHTNGVWYQVREGIHGILVYDEKGEPHCFMLTQASTHYFKIMTGNERMPALINQVL